MVAPPGIKVVEFDEMKSQDDYVHEGWIEKMLGCVLKGPMQFK